MKAQHDYRGPAVLCMAETENSPSREIDVDVVLRGHFQPIDGRFHWYGRISHSIGHQIGHKIGQDMDLEQVSTATNRTVVLRTPEGEATGTLSDRDPWNRYRISGRGKPPFRTDLH